MDFSGIILVVGGVVLVVLLLKLLSAPIKLALKLLLHAVIGFVALFLLNFFGAAIGITLEMTWLNAIVAGVLGIPGVLLLLLFKFVF